MLLCGMFVFFRSLLAGLSRVVYLPYRAEMCHIVSVRRSQRVGASSLSLGVVYPNIVRHFSPPRGLDHRFGCSDHLRSSCLLLAAHHPQRRRPGALRSFPNADIYISSPTLLFGETQWCVARVILFVHFSDMTNEASVLLCHRLDGQQTGSK